MASLPNAATVKNRIHSAFFSISMHSATTEITTGKSSENIQTEVIQSNGHVDTAEISSQSTTANNNANIEEDEDSCSGLEDDEAAGSASCKLDPYSFSDEDTSSAVAANSVTSQRSLLGGGSSYKDSSTVIKAEAADR